MALEVVAIANACVWLVAVPVLWLRLRRAGRLGSAAIAALLVAMLAAALGGGVGPLLYPSWLDLEGARMVGAAWRAAMLTCGLYAMTRER